MIAQEVASSRVLLSVREVGVIIGRSRSFIHDEVRTGRLTSFKHGGRRRFHRLDVDRYLQGLREAKG